MGRFAQARRRGGGGGAPLPPTPSPVTLLSVRADGTDWILTFDGPITCDVGLQDDNFLVGDASFFNCQGAAGSVCSGVDDNSGGYLPGQVWGITAQPNWLLTPLAAPSFGTTI